MTCRERTTCRLCSGVVETKLKLPDTPLANELEEVGSEPSTERFPLELRQCVACGHVQLGHVVDQKRLFGDYAYASGVSASFRAHFAEYAQTVSSMMSGPGLVVEIGSNDGTLLAAFESHGHRVIGVEPSARLTSPVETIRAFFTPELAATIRLSAAADCIVANNVLAHIDDLDEVMRGVKILLRPDGLFVFEVQYLPAMIQRGTFDMIYHEHLDYHHVETLLRFLRKHDFALLDVERVNTHGGSIRCIAKRDCELSTMTPRLCRMLALEGMHPPDPRRIERTIERARESFLALSENVGGSVAGYGAPAKLTTLTYALGGLLRHVEFVVDDNPLKQGRLTPGKRWPILPVEELVKRQPRYCVLFAWNVADDCIKRARAAGYTGEFIVPLPTPRVVL